MNIEKQHKKTKNNKKHKQSGFAALFVIAVIGAAGLLMAYTASILGLGELEMGYAAQKGSEAFFIADGCMEETYRRIRLNTNYGVGAGTINLTVPNGSCAIDVTDLGGNQRRIDILGTTGDYNRTIRSEITLTGNVITVDLWEELSN
jgi:hypothetical protein